MKIGTACLVIFLFSLTLPVLPARAEGGAAILFDYPGAVLLLDDGSVTCREADTIMVEPGEYSLTLYLPPRDGQWLPSIISRHYALCENESVAIRPETIRYLAIRTVPDGAEMFLDGQFLGHTPIAVSVIHPLDTSIVLEKTGYRTGTLFLGDLAPGSPVHLSLEPAGGRDTGEPIRAAEIEGGRSWGWLPYITLSYFAASTAFGFYNKGRADDLYEEYLSTSSRDRMDDLFERAEVMDKRARLFWITGEVALGATIYLFVQKFRQDRGDRPQPALNVGLSPRGERGFFLSLEYAVGGK